MTPNIQRQKRRTGVAYQSDQLRLSTGLDCQHASSHKPANRGENLSHSSSGNKSPTGGLAKGNAFLPSCYPLTQFISTKSNQSDGDDPGRHTGGRWKVLVVGADKHCLLTDNGTMNSAGNDPVETLLPIWHLDKAGFSIDITTLSGNPVKLESWAMPTKDKEVMGF